MNSIICSATLKEAFSQKSYYLMCFLKAILTNEIKKGSQFNVLDQLERDLGLRLLQHEQMSFR